MAAAVIWRVLAVDWERIFFLVVKSFAEWLSQKIIDTKIAEKKIVVLAEISLSLITLEIFLEFFVVNHLARLDMTTFELYLGNAGNIQIGYFFFEVFGWVSDEYAVFREVLLTVNLVWKRAIEVIRELKQENLLSRRSKSRQESASTQKFNNVNLK